MLNLNKWPTSPPTLPPKRIISSLILQSYFNLLTYDKECKYSKTSDCRVADCPPLPQVFGGCVGCKRKRATSPQQEVGDDTCYSINTVYIALKPNLGYEIQ